MAFYNKKYTDDCRAWISKNQNLYENTIDNIKSFLELGGLLHIYGVAVDNMPDKSLFLKYEDYKKYVKSYHKLIHSITGVRTLLSRSDSPFSIFSSEEDVVFFCLSWVIHGDFYETLIYQIIACYDYPKFKNRQRELVALKNRFIFESILLGIKSLDDWKKYDKDMKEIKGWTVLSEDFVAPQTLGQEGEPPIVPATDDNKKEGEKDNTVGNKTDKAAFLNMLKCNDDKKKAAVIMAIADEIKSNNTGERIAFIKLALEKNAMIDPKLSFSSFYEALTESISPFMEGEKPVSRVYSSKIYSASWCLLNRTDDNCRNEKEKTQLIELNRICEVLKAAENNA